MLHLVAELVFARKMQSVSELESILMTRALNIMRSEAFFFFGSVSYSKLNKKVRIKHLSEDCRKLLGKAGNMIEVNHLEDPHYKAAADSIIS